MYNLETTKKKIYLPYWVLAISLFCYVWYLLLSVKNPLISTKYVSIFYTYLGLNVALGILLVIYPIIFNHIINKEKDKLYTDV